MVMVCLGLATCMASTIDIEYLCFHLFIKVWGGGGGPSMLSIKPPTVLSM